MSGLLVAAVTSGQEINFLSVLLATSRRDKNEYMDVKESVRTEGSRTFTFLTVQVQWKLTADGSFVSLVALVALITLVTLITIVGVAWPNIPVGDFVAICIKHRSCRH